MITLKYEIINDNAFNQVLAKLMRSEKLDVRTAYNVGRIARQVEKEVGAARELFQKLIDRHAIKDEKGNVVPQVRSFPQEDGTAKEMPLPGSYTVADENKEAFDKDIETFLALTFDVKSFKLSIEQLGGVGLSPLELMALEPVLLEEVEQQQDQATA